MARTFTAWDDAQLLGPWPEGWEPEIAELRVRKELWHVYACVPKADGEVFVVQAQVRMVGWPGLDRRALYNAKQVIMERAKAVYAEQRLAWLTTQRLEGEGSLAERAEHGLRYGTSHK